MSRTVQWTRENALVALQAAAQDHGGAWTKIAWSMAHKQPSTATLEKLFGSWSSAWDVAGYPVNYGWTPMACLQVLHKVGVERGQWITMAEWTQSGYSPSVQVILHHFGHWRTAWQAAGFDAPLDRREFLGYKTWSKAEIVNALKRQARVDGTIMGMVEWRRRRCQPSITTIRKYWGSYARAIQAAGLTVQTDRYREMQRRQGLWKTAWEQLSHELGHPPSRQEWDAWPGRPASAQKVWPVIGGEYKKTPLKREIAQVNLDLVANPQLNWALAYRGGASIKELAQAQGLTRDCIREGLIRAIQQARVVGAAFDVARTLDPDHLTDDATKKLITAARANLPLAQIMEETGLSARQIVARIHEAKDPTVVSAAAVRRLAKELAQEPVLWTEDDYRWVHHVLDAGSIEVYARLYHESVQSIIARISSLHAVARRKPVWVQWARDVLEQSGTLLPVNLRAILEGLAAGESLRHVTARLGQDYTRTCRHLYRLRQSEQRFAFSVAQG
ncbi:MAG: hypothetical protein C7B45_07040 [Sulfobacillus acidophilus]|uniref:Uncharacterized protein n=1 Tax=Sulfobacillus acidophilus TaxID=53633 RepID=A0A2T2WJF8_9FIRM|nr:MAG: hypothetical protein C7B45_07040 [Sulfobacillus acidophilus]